MDRGLLPIWLTPSDALGAFFGIGLALLARGEGGGPTGRAAEERAATGAA